MKLMINQKKPFLGVIAEELANYMTGQNENLNERFDQPNILCVYAHVYFFEKRFQLQLLSEGKNLTIKGLRITGSSWCSSEWIELHVDAGVFPPHCSLRSLS